MRARPWSESVDTNGCGTTITTDQRGVTRPQGSACDSGAMEVVRDVGHINNDNFADATVISSLPYTDTQDTTSSTKEAGEPLECTNWLEKSIWYRFTAPSSGAYQIVADTAGSNYDTVLDIFSTPTPASFSTLTRVGCNDDSGPGRQSLLNLTLSGGTTYYIRVSDYASSGGTSVLNVSAVTTTDTTPPTITPTMSGTLGTNGWYTSNVAVSWAVTDEESAVSSQTGCEAVTVSTDTTGTTSTCSATSAGGTNQQSVTIKRDATASTVSLVNGPADGQSYVFGSVPSAPTCTASDATSGLAEACSISGYRPTVGTHTVTASAIDNAGNTNTDSHTYTVQGGTLKGYYQPVDMNGVVNTVKGGSTVPLKFEVFAGSTEVTSTTVVTMSAKQITCTSNAATDDVELVATGGTSLRYDTTGGQFIYNWQTPKKAGTCYAVTATTSDGSTLTALFKLK